MPDKNLRIAVMWTELSGYLNACLLALNKRYQVELDITRIAREGPDRRPYDEAMFAWMPRLRTLPDGDGKHAEKVLNEMTSFDPHVAIISGWSTPVYRKIARVLRQRGVYVIGTADNPWRGSLKQHLGILISPWYVRPLFDVLWVPGERGATFASKLGFQGQHLMQGLYSADREKFEAAGAWRENLGKKDWPRRFFFAGRLAEEKGIEDLISAYQIYRKIAQDPWELWIAGSGPLEGMLSGVEGVRLLGFVQPEDYDRILRQVSVFVLPSHFEPWGLVIHEMAIGGLPILCSRQCGSSVELVQDGYNGYLFEAGDIEGLASLLNLMTGERVDLQLMGRRSALLSHRYSPEQWADYLVGNISRNAQIG